MPQQTLDEVKAFRDVQGSNNIYHPHRMCDSIERIARDPAIVAVARDYLGIEPILYSSRLYYTAPKRNTPQQRAARGGGGRVRLSYPVHFDVADFKDLTLFIYLSDVDQDSSPHVVVENTHQHKTMREVLKGKLTEEQARRRFGSSVKTITGISGSCFFEDTSAYHMMSTGKQGRWMLLICYTIQLSPELSQGSHLIQKHSVR